MTNDHTPHHKGDRHEKERFTPIEFELLLDRMLGKPVEEMTVLELERQISLTQAATDRLLNEFERRRLLTVEPTRGAPIVPYYVPDECHVDTILTR